MCSKDTYRLLFKEDGFTPINYTGGLGYEIDRKMSCVNLLGIGYNQKPDLYEVYISGTYYGDYDDIIDAIMAYDEHTTGEKYVVNGRRTSLGSSKYFTPFNREYIARYAGIYSVGAMARQLKIPTKELDKYITRYHTKPKDSTNPTLVIWDIRAKYDDVAMDILNNTLPITDDDIDALLGLG